MNSTESKSLSTLEQASELAIADVAKIAAIKSATVRTSLEAYVKGEVLVTAAVNKAGTAIEDVRRKQATAIGKLTKEAIKEAGFDSLSKLCESVNLCDKSKQTISQLTAAGIVYNDSDAPDALKALSVSKLGQAGVLIRDKDAYTALKEAAKSGEITADMTLDNIKSYVESHRPITAKVLPTYGAKVNGEYIKQNSDILYKTVSEWQEWINGECVKLPDNESGEKRFLSIVDGNKLTLYTLVKREKPSSKPKEDNKPKVSIADMAKLLGVSVEKLTALQQANND